MFRDEQSVLMLSYEPVGVRNVITTIEREVVLARERAGFQMVSSHRESSSNVNLVESGWPLMKPASFNKN